MKKISDNIYLKNTFLKTLDECAERTNSKITFKSTNPENGQNPAYLATVINNNNKYHLSVIFLETEIDSIKVDVRDNSGGTAHIGEIMPSENCEEDLKQLIEKAFDTRINNLENEKHLFCLEKIERRAKLASETFDFYKDNEKFVDINKSFNEGAEILKNNYISACNFLNLHLQECTKLENCLDDVRSWKEVDELADRGTNEKMEEKLQKGNQELEKALKLEPNEEMNQNMIDFLVFKAREKVESEKYQNVEKEMWRHYYLNTASNIYNVHAQRMIQCIVDYEVGIENLCRQTENLLLNKENNTNKDRALMATMPLTVQMADEELYDYKNSHCVALVNDVLDELEREGRIKTSSIKIEEER